MQKTPDTMSDALNASAAHTSTTSDTATQDLTFNLSDSISTEIETSGEIALPIKANLDAAKELVNTYLQSIGRNAIKIPIVAEGRDLARAGSMSFEQGLLQAVQQRRAASGNPKIQAAVAQQQQRMQSLSYDVENTYYPNSPKANILSYSYIDRSPGEKPIKQTIVPKGWEAEVDRAIAEHLSVGRGKDVDFLRNLKERIREGVASKAYTVVNDNEFASKVASTFPTKSNVASTTLMGFNSQTTAGNSDVNKLYHLFKGDTVWGSNLSRERMLELNGTSSSPSQGILNQTVDLAQWAKQYMGISGTQKGWNLSSIGQRLGVLPKTMDAHESMWDTEVTDAIGAIKQNIEASQTSVNSGGTRSPLHSLVRDQLSTNATPWRETILAEAIAQDIGKLRYGTHGIYKDGVSAVSADDVDSLANARYTSFVNTGAMPSVRPKPGVAPKHAQTVPIDVIPTGEAYLEKVYAGEIAPERSLLSKPAKLLAEERPRTAYPTEQQYEPAASNNLTSLGKRYGLQFVEEMRQEAVARYNGGKKTGNIPVLPEREAKQLFENFIDSVGRDFASLTVPAGGGLNTPVSNQTIGSSIKEHLRKSKDLRDAWSKVFASPVGEDAQITFEQGSAAKFAPLISQISQTIGGFDYGAIGLSSTVKPQINRNTSYIRPEVWDTDLNPSEVARRRSENVRYSGKGLASRLLQYAEEANLHPSNRNQYITSDTARADQEKKARARLEADIEDARTLIPVKENGQETYVPKGFERKSKEEATSTALQEEVAARSNIARGIHFENTPKAVELLKKKGYDVLQFGEKEGRPNYEATGRYGDVEFHPDLVATMPAVSGKYARNALITDIKSPQRHIPDEETARNLLLNQRREWAAQVALYAVGSGLPLDAVKLGIVHEGSKGKAALTTPISLDSLINDPSVGGQLLKSVVHGAQNIYRPAVPKSYPTSQDGLTGLDTSLLDRISLVDTNLKLPTPKVPYSSQEQKQLASARAQANNAAFDSLHKQVNNLIRETGSPEKAANVIQDRSNSWFEKTIGDNQPHLASLVDAFGNIGSEDAYRPKLAAAVRTYGSTSKTKEDFTSAFRNPSAEAVDSTESIEKKLQEQVTARSAKEAARKETISKLNQSHDAVLQQMRENGILLRGGFTDDTVSGSFTPILGPKRSKSVGGEAYLRDNVDTDPWFVKPGMQSIFGKADEAKNVLNLIKGHKRGVSQAWLSAQNLVMEGEAARVAGPETTNEYIKSRAVPSVEGVYKETLDFSLGKMAYHQTEVNALGKLQPTYEAITRLLDKGEKALNETVDSYVNSAVKLLSTIQSTRGQAKGAALHDYGQAITKLQSVGINTDKLGLPDLVPSSKAQREGFNNRAAELTQIDKGRAKARVEAEQLPIEQQLPRFNNLQRAYTTAQQQYVNATSGMKLIEAIPELSRTEAQQSLYKRLSGQKESSFENMQILKPQMAALVRGYKVSNTSKSLGGEETQLFVNTQKLIADQIKKTEEETQQYIKKHVENAQRLADKIETSTGSKKGAAIFDYQAELNALSSHKVDLKQLGLTPVAPSNEYEKRGYTARQQQVSAVIGERNIEADRLTTLPLDNLLSIEQRSKLLSSVQKKYDAAQYGFLSAKSNVAVLENIPSSMRTEEQDKLLNKYKTQQNVSFEMMQLYQPQIENIIGVGPNKLNTSEATKAKESFQLTNTVIERQTDAYLKEVTKFIDDSMREARSIASQIGHLPASETRGKLMKRYNDLLTPMQAHGIDLNALGLTTYDKGQMTTPDLAGYNKQTQLSYSNVANWEQARTRLSTPGEELYGTETYSKYVSGLQGKLAKTDLNAQFAKFATERLAGINTEEASTMRTGYGKQYERSILESSLLQQFISERAPSLSSELSLTPSEAALKSVKDKRTSSLEQHVNNALLAQTEAENFGLTPELFKTIATSSTAIRSLGGKPMAHGIDIGKLATLTTTSLLGSRELQSISGLLGNENAEPFSAARSQDSYVKQLDTAIEQSRSIKVDTPFVELGKAIEHDIQLVNLYNQAMSSISQSTPEGRAEFNRLQILKTGVQSRISENRDKLDNSYQSQRQVLDNYKYDDTRVAAGANWYEDYQAQKRSAIIGKAEQLQAIVSGGGYNPEISAEIVKLAKVAKKEGAIDDFSKVVNIEDLVHSAAVAPMQGRMTKNMTNFVTNAQVMNSAISQGSITGLGGVDVFDAMYQKERAALATVNELKTALAECGNISLDKIDSQFNDLSKEVQGNITKLHDLQSMIRSTGISPTAAMIADITRLKQNITDGVTQLDKLRSGMKNERPGFTRDVWTARKSRVEDEREKEEFDLLVQAQAANARIAVGNRASYKDYKRSHDLAKEIEDRGIDPTVFGLNWEKDGIFSKRHVENIAKENKKPYFGDQHHVNFTEQLVDLANWQLQWAGATAVIQGFSTALYGGFGAAREFESQMKDVELIMQANDRQMKAVEATVVKLGSNFKVPIKELAEGLVILGQAGYGATESVQMIQPISQLAVATRATHKEASDITTSVMMSYDQPSFNAKEVTNTLAAATIESKLELGSLGTTFNYIASTAAQAGLSLEDTTTAMGLMSNAGVRASTIGTSLRSILGALLAPTARFKAELGRVGVSMDELNPRTHSIEAVLTKLNESGFSVENAFEGMSKREAGALSSLLGQASKWGSFRSKITGTDRAEMMAVGQMDTLDAQTKRLHNVATLTGVNVYSGAMVPLKTGTKLAADGLEWISKLAGSDTGKSVSQVMSLGVAAMSTATILTTAGKALGILAPAAYRGIKTSFGMEVPFIQQDQRRSKITSGIESMAGLVFNPWALAIAGTALAGTYVGSKVTAGDKLFGMDTSNWFGGRFDRGTAALAKETAKSDYATNMVSTLASAAKQEEQLRVANRGNANPERRALIDSLVASGFYVGKDREGQRVTADTLKAGGMAVDLVGGIDQLNLQAVGRGASYYAERVVTPETIKQIMVTGSKDYKTSAKVKSKEGQEYAQFAADKLIAQLKAEGIYYDSTRTAEFLNKNIESNIGGAPIGREVRQLVMEKQEQALLAPDRSIAESDMARTTFTKTMQQVVDARKAANTADTSIEAIRLREGFRKEAVFTALANPEVETALTKDPRAREVIANAQVRIQEAKTPKEAEAAFNSLYAYLEELSTRPGMESLKGITARIKASETTAYSPEEIGKLDTKAKAAYDTYLLKNPDKASRAEYATAKVKFAETIGVDLNKYQETSTAAEEAQKKLATMRIGDPGFAEQTLKVNMYNMALEELNNKMKPLYQESLKFSMKDIDSNLRNTMMDLRYPAQYAVEAKQAGKGSSFTSMPTIMISEFRAQAKAVGDKYATILQEPSIAGNKVLTTRVKLAMQLETEDIQEALITKAGQKIKEASDKLASLYGREASNITTKIGIEADISTLKVDTAQSALKERLLTAPQTKLKSSEPFFTGIDWTTKGFGYYGQQPSYTTPYQKAPLFQASQFSTDIMFLESIKAEAEKINISRSSSKATFDTNSLAAYQSYKQKMTGIYKIHNIEPLNQLPETPAMRAESQWEVIGKGEKARLIEKPGPVQTDIASAQISAAAKKELLTQEQEYTAARISNSAKELQAITKNIQSEIALRDKLLDKIKEVQSGSYEAQRGFDKDSKELLKAAGINTKSNPNKMIQDLQSLYNQASVYADNNDLENFNKTVGRARDIKSDLVTEGYAPSYLKKASDIFQQFKGLDTKIRTGQVASYTEQLSASNLRQTNMTADQTKHVGVIREAISRDKSLTESERGLRLDEFNRRVEANKNDPEMMQKLMQGYESNPYLTKDLTGAEAAKELNDAFKDLAKTIKGINTAYKEKGTDVTPNGSVKELIGEDTAKALGLESGSRGPAMREVENLTTAKGSKANALYMNGEILYTKGADKKTIAHEMAHYTADATGKKFYSRGNTAEQKLIEEAWADDIAGKDVKRLYGLEHGFNPEALTADDVARVKRSSRGKAYWKEYAGARAELADTEPIKQAIGLPLTPIADSLSLSNYTSMPNLNSRAAFKADEDAISSSDPITDAIKRVAATTGAYLVPTMYQNMKYHIGHELAARKMGKAAFKHVFGRTPTYIPRIAAKAPSWPVKLTATAVSAGLGTLLSTDNAQGAEDKPRTGLKKTDEDVTTLNLKGYDHNDLTSAWRIKNDPARQKLANKATLIEPLLDPTILIGGVGQTGVKLTAKTGAKLLAKRTAVAAENVAGTTAVEVTERATQESLARLMSTRSVTEVVETAAPKTVMTKAKDFVTAPFKVLKRGYDFIDRNKVKGVLALGGIALGGKGISIGVDKYKTTSSDGRLDAMDAQGSVLPTIEPKAELDTKSVVKTPAKMSIEEYTVQASKWLREAYQRSLAKEAAEAAEAAKLQPKPAEAAEAAKLQPKPAKTYIPVTGADLKEEQKKRASQPLSDISEAMDIWNSIKATSPIEKEKKARRIFAKRKASKADIESFIGWGKNSDFADQTSVDVVKGPKEGSPANLSPNNIWSESVPPAGIISANNATKPLNLSLGKDSSGKDLDKEFRRMIGRPTVADKQEGKPVDTSVGPIISADKDIAKMQAQLRAKGDPDVADRLDGIMAVNKANEKLRTGLDSKLTGPRYELGTAEQAPSGTADSLLASNEKLTQAIDNLRTTLEKSGVNGQTATSSNQAAAKSTASVGVSVTIPVTVEAGGETSAEKVGQNVEKVCRDFFDKEFGPRFVQACNTVNIT